MTNETKRCRTCDAEIDKRSYVCSNCGAKQRVLISPKLEKCRYCNGDMAANLNACPHCGRRPLRIIIGYSICAVVIALTVIFVIAILSSDTSNTKTTNNTENIQIPAEEYIYISAVDLLNAYEENEVNADKTYKGKTIVVDGIVSDLGETEQLGLLGGDTFILLDNAGTNTITFSSVQCNFTNKDEINKVANISKGQKISIKGTCSGESFYNVMISNCFIVSE